MSGDDYKTRVVRLNLNVREKMNSCNPSSFIVSSKYFQFSFLFFFFFKVTINFIPQVVSCIGLYVPIQRYSCGKVNYGKFSMGDCAVLAFLLKWRLVSNEFLNVDLILTTVEQILGGNLHFFLTPQLISYTVHIL